MHVIAAKAVAFHEALQPDFLRYSQEVIDNARVLGDTLSAGGLRLVTGGTDCHLLLADLRPFNVAGHVAVEALERRSEERRVGKECVRQCSSRWSQNHSNKKV